MENEEVTLNCTASGNPTPTITWIKNGKTVTEGETLSFEAHRSQSGQYWCLAENGLEVSANASAYLDVQCKYGSNVVTELKKAVSYSPMFPLLFWTHLKHSLTFSEVHVPRGFNHFH